MIATIIIGLIVGGVASLLVPGRTPGGMLGTFAVGLVGAIIGDALTRGGFIWPLIVSIVFAAIVLVVLNTVMRRA